MLPNNFNIILSRDPNMEMSLCFIFTAFIISVYDLYCMN